MSEKSREAILTAATRIAQAHGYGGLNFRDLAADVGIKAPSIYHHFASKADLGAAVAKRYWEDTAADLERISKDAGDPRRALNEYPNIFRRSLENGNRLCLCSFMSAEHDDLPTEVQKEVQAFADVNVAWLSRALRASGLAVGKESEIRARSIFAAVAGAQLMARSRVDIELFDRLIDGYRAAGLLPDAKVKSRRT
ncbi:TetR/AcrR family transcriptional regulator [uncultured Bradyrhizobium sp.]|uniref:TetR/AcrR family transcriptional regulator n=1 Tax=Bradyrhizobium sp. TaxID=376 RepID=UPI00260F3554|nr:TetR/AcrR family transcriptional regulator [uncultured Bradyrhizobium sp.]